MAGNLLPGLYLVAHLKPRKTDKGREREREREGGGDDDDYFFPANSETDRQTNEQAES